MSLEFGDIERYDASCHDTAGFHCGNAALDHWLKRYAGQNSRRDAARTFVATTEGNVVCGYHTLLVGQINHQKATTATNRGLSPHYPIPVAILARLAIDTRHQGKGLGAALLTDAVSRVHGAAKQVGIRAIVVHAIDQGAIAFYERFGFRSTRESPRTLMITLAELREAIDK